MKKNELIEGIRKKDEKSVKYFLDNYKKMIKFFIIKIGGNKNELEISEISSDVIYTFTNKCINNPEFKLYDNCKMSTYLYNITSNIIKKYHSNRNIKNIVYIGEYTQGNSNSYTQEFDFEIDYKTFLLRESIKSLNDSDKKLMKLFIDGYSTEDILKLSSIKNKNSLKTKKYKIIKKIKNIIKTNIAH